MICKGSILRNQARAGFWPARAWFKKREFILQILTNSKPTINTSYAVSVQAVALVTSLHQCIIFPRDNLFVSLFSGIHQICIPAFPFDLPMQNGSWLHGVLLLNPSPLPSLGIIKLHWLLAQTKCTNWEIKPM